MTKRYRSFGESITPRRVPPSLERKIRDSNSSIRSKDNTQASQTNKQNPTKKQRG